MPFESVPVAGIAVTVGTIYLEIQDACATMEEFDELTAKLDLDGADEEVDKSFCSLSRDDLVRLTTGRTDDFEACIAREQSGAGSDVNTIMECLPEEIDDVGIPKREFFDMPKPAQL